MRSRDLQKKSNRREGSTLLMFMGIVCLVTLVVGMAWQSARQNSYSVGRVRDYVKAQLISEAGANDAYHALKEDYSKRNDPSAFPPISFVGGSYDVTVTAVGDEKASILSSAIYNDVTAITRVDVMLRNKILASDGTYKPPLSSPYAYTIFVNGSATFNGSSRFNGYMHVNNDIIQNGSSSYGEATDPCHIRAVGGIKFSGHTTLYGDLTAPEIDASVSPGTVIVKDVDVVKMPTLNLTPYYNIALANGQVLSGNQIISADTTWNIPGGVKWIDGSLTVKNGVNLSFNGAIIATGDIDIKGEFDLSSSSANFLIASRDGNITINSGHNFKGLIYAGGDITYNGSGNWLGSMICGGNLTFNGSGSRLTYKYYDPIEDSSSTPGATNNMPQIVVSAWQE